MFDWVLNTLLSPFVSRFLIRIATGKKLGPKFFSRLSAVLEKMSWKIVRKRLISEAYPFDVCPKIVRHTL